MASDFKIGTSSGSMTALDSLTIPCEDPQWEFREYTNKLKLGNGSMFGVGPQKVIWEFPLIEDAQIAQLTSFVSTSEVYIQSKKQDGTLGVFSTLMNWIDPREDGDHMVGFRGYRSGLMLEFTVYSEVI